ncbi:RNA polymerase sigma factor SigX [Aneurinibacillus sp. BA2021]|nr:RNA polymerase sigma factor SigX [Aneurinibacillus sp. BA2021]
MEVQVALTKEKAFTTASAPAENFQELFTAYYPSVVRQIMRVVKEKAVAEDVAQEVFLKLYNTDRTQIANIPAWLAKTALHMAYNYIRSANRRQARDEKAGQEQETHSLSSEEKWLKEDEILTVREVLNEMDERDRTLLLMKYSGFNYKELADAVHVESSSIGTLLSRAKVKFRTMYKQMRGYQE